MNQTSLSYDPATHKSGFIAIIGKPNVGKSTLMNQLIGAKLSITSNKPQTTRNRVLGIWSDDDHQIIFVDTPGLITPKYKLHEAMMRYVEQAKQESDLVFFLVDASNPEYPEFAYEALRSIHKPIYAILNKIDIIDQIRTNQLLNDLESRYNWEQIIPISALSGIGVAGLLDIIKDNVPIGPPFYPKDMISEHPERFFVSEIIREKLFECYHEEIPYSCAVNIINYSESEEKDVIDADIVVDRDSQKGIIIGKHGKAIKNVGIKARKDIEEFLGKPVRINLFVKVRPKWRERDTFLRDFGYQ